MTVAVLLAAVVVLVRVPRPIHRARAVTETEFFDAVAAELRRGASLRHAIGWALPGTRPARLALTGQPLERVVGALQHEIGLGGSLPAAGIDLAGRSGAPAAGLFARMADAARSRTELGRELRTMSAQARLSAVVVGLLPIGAGLLVATLRAEDIVASGPARGVVIAGMVMQLLGAAFIGALLRRHR